MINLTDLLTIRQSLRRFKQNHPQFRTFVSDVVKQGPCAGQKIRISVQQPDGSLLETEVDVAAEDMDFLRRIYGLVRSIN